MCGIIAIASDSPIVSLLLQGLTRLEYRGYDSSGIALITSNNSIECVKAEGRVSILENKVSTSTITGNTGIAHTRWATHGKPSDINAHPHISEGRIAMVHNGIIENYQELKQNLTKEGYTFLSHTDSEVIAHLIHQNLATTSHTIDAIQKATKQLKGAFSLAILDTTTPNRVYGYCHGSPLIIGKGANNFAISSDAIALADIGNEILPLNNHELVVLEQNNIEIYQYNKKIITNSFRPNTHNPESLGLGAYATYTEKEIHEQPNCITECLEGRIDAHTLTSNLFNTIEDSQLLDIQSIQIVACGTSYHAGLVAQYWFESINNIPTNVDIASEFIYRQRPIHPKSLLITISQSGETADTIAAFRASKHLFHKTLSITNRIESTLGNETDIQFLTHAGPEIGVASTKAFTTQLTALLMLSLKLSNNTQHNEIIQALTELPQQLQLTLNATKNHTPIIRNFFNQKTNSIFLGRGIHHPIAQEGALKLKELSYIHAEAYPAGELKHGPLAVIDQNIPVVAVAPNDELLSKIITNIHEVHARGGKLLVISDHHTNQEYFQHNNEVTNLTIPTTNQYTSPILYTIPLQWIAYQVALLKGTDIDKPRNLAKSVTVE